MVARCLISVSQQYLKIGNNYRSLNNRFEIFNKTKCSYRNHLIQCSVEQISIS